MTRSELHTQILIYACDPDTREWSNQKIADDLGVGISEVSRARADVARDGLLYPGRPGIAGLRLTPAGVEHVEGRGWEVAA